MFVVEFYVRCGGKQQSLERPSAFKNCSSGVANPKTLHRKVRFGTRMLDNGVLKVSLLFVVLKVRREILWLKICIARSLRIELIRSMAQH
jgi:hypothetical protein